MEHIDYSEIIKKIGPEKDLSKLTEEELLYYDMVRAVKSKAADKERKMIKAVMAWSSCSPCINYRSLYLSMATFKIT
jgi:hypothetical protein